MAAVDWRKANLRITKGTRVGGKPARPGDVLDVGKDCTYAEARLIVGQQQGEPTTDKPKRVKKGEAEPSRRARRTNQTGGLSSRSGLVEGGEDDADGDG